MTNASEPSLSLAKRVLRAEVREASSAEQLSVAGERIVVQLETQLGQWFGADGYHAVLGRALDRVRSLHPELSHVDGPAEDPLRGLRDGLRTHPAPGAERALISLLATIFSILGRLVGDDMVARLVYQTWPQAMATAPRPSDSRTVSRE